MIRDRRSSTPIEVVSIPSSVILPEKGSAKRNMDMASVDLPDPAIISRVCTGATNLSCQ